MSNAPSTLLVEDQPLVRLGLRAALQKMNCCQVLGEIDNGESAVRETQRLQPQLVLMDVGLPGIDGIEATSRIKQQSPRTRVIMLTANTTPASVKAALRAGADGYCSKNGSASNLASAIDSVMNGAMWLDENIASILSDDAAAGNTNATHVSDLEKQILSLMQQGLGNGCIATRLRISTAKVAELTQAMFNRFAENTTLIEHGQAVEKICSKEWMTTCIDNIQEEKVFAEKYVIEELVAAGGIGAVYKAKHLYMDRYVALKLLHPQYGANRFALRSFQREAMSIATLQHPNIVSVYDFGITANEPFLVMEYIDGCTLADLLKQQQSLPVPRVMEICAQICAGLAEAHSKGIVHCDLKPSNILLAASPPHEIVKLVDFGLAQAAPRMAANSCTTERTVISGTPAYMPPEQCAGSATDSRSDIYSLGCILYECLTGVNVFDGKSPMATFTRQFQLIAPPMSTIHPGPFPSRLERGIARMLAKDPCDRPQSIGEVQSVLGLT